MKKIVLALLVFGGLTSLHATHDEFCITCPQGIQGEQGEQGPIGETGATGATGNDGADGQDGSDGQDGTNGLDGQDGATGADGQDGIDGTNGVDGSDGADGRVDYTEVNKFMQEFRQRAKDAEKYQAESNAGASAMASIDFGSTKKGDTFGGIGIGYSSTYNTNGVAGAVGIKHGMTDTEAIIIKAWGANSKSYGAGLGVTTKF